jgi:hypothetical protein
LEKFGKRLEKRLEEKLEIKLETKLETKLDSKLDAKFKFYSAQLDAKFESNSSRLERNIDEKLSKWKDEIFNLVDGLAIEIRDGREHRAFTSHQITENRERIEKLEHKVFGAVATV